MRIFGVTVFSGKVVAGVLSCLVLVVAGVLQSGCSREAGGGGSETLFVVSPHGTDIRREFAGAFSEWHEKKFGKPVVIQWPDIGGGGTGNISRYLETQYVTGKRTTSDYDVVFGGGSASFDEFASRGYLEKLPAEILGLVPRDIHGTPLVDGEGRWVAATMSNFGIVVNKDRMGELGLAMPVVWEDVTGPKWFGHLSLADPSKSGSVRSSFEMLFQQYGWERGWGDMVLLFANAEAVREAGSNPADDVGSAQAVGGVVIDFYGRKHITRVGPHIVSFVIPEGGTTIDPDPIALLKGAPNKKVAVRFIEFVLSPEGQRMWTHKAKTAGGPKRNELGRLSVQPGLYETESGLMKDAFNPFKLAAPLKADQKAARMRSGFIGDLLKYALIDNHEELVRARKAVMEAGDPEELMRKLKGLPTYVPSELIFASVSSQGGTQGATQAGTQAGTQGGVAVEIRAGAATQKGVVVMTVGALREVAELYKPKDKVAAERNQAAMRAHWQKEFAGRFKAVEEEAKGWKAGGKTVVKD